MSEKGTTESSAVDQLLEHLLSLTESRPVETEDHPRSPSPETESRPTPPASIGISRIEYRGYKALGNYDVPLRHVNILTGTNNAGKSTALSALRVLGAGLSVAWRKKPESIRTPEGLGPGYRVPVAGLADSLENVHTDLNDRDSTVTFSYANGGELILRFPREGGCLLLVGPNSELAPRSPKGFRRSFDTRIVQVPVLGPLEHEEPLLKRETVKGALSSHRASRHFRNFWHHFPEGFEQFSTLLGATWPGMVIEKPELQVGLDGGRLSMFCREERMTRELFWAGFGFQIWCQLLTHVCRATPRDLIVVDEPETYLHPIVQRRLLGVLRGTGAQVVLATHSASIVMVAEDDEVVVVDRKKRTAMRQQKRTAALAAQLGFGNHRERA